MELKIFKHVQLSDSSKKVIEGNSHRTISRRGRTGIGRTTVDIKTLIDF